MNCSPNDICIPTWCVRAKNQQIQLLSAEDPEIAVRNALRFWLRDAGLEMPLTVSVDGQYYHVKEMMLDIRPVGGAL